MLQPTARVATNYGSQREPARTANKDLGKDEFLQLLTQQLKYQDPLSPMDNQAFIAQMAQFSSLEQMKNLNESLNTYLKVTALNDQRYQAVNLIGKTISGTDANGRNANGKVDGLRFDSGLPVLLIGEQEIKLSDVEKI